MKSPGLQPISTTFDVAKHIDVIAREIDRVCADIRHLESMVDKFVGFGMTIVGAGLAIGLVSKTNEVFFALPIGIFGIYFMFLDRMRSILYLGAYKRALEEKLNALAKTAVLRWERIVWKHRGRDVIVWSIDFVYLIVLAGAVGFSLIKIASGAYSAHIVWGYVVLVCALEILLGFCVIRWFRVYAPAYDACKSELGLPLRLISSPPF